ncbi:cytidine deaminase [Zobellella maritima]|uniref:cytidine deaminase n=1 Tax=Zobellella maritima TaxID=2059725 RepID=UPI000E307DE1|nr:cytidine deaminase [Zobellella maritima]
MTHIPLNANLQLALTRAGLADCIAFSPPQVRALAQATALNNDALALALLPLAQQKASATVSRFHVGAIAVGGSGHWYLGANLEVPDLPLNHSLHAEQAAIGHAALRGEQSIEKIVVSAPPCGHCRQFMNELNQGDSLTILLPDGSHKLGDLLPHAFGPADLGIRGGMLGAAAGQLDLSSEDPLLLAALAEANASHAPYSGNRAGVVLALDDGRLCRGRYLENAAFNPSLSPMQMALSQLMLGGGQGGQIVRAVLVEQRAPIRQYETAAQTLSRFTAIPLTRVTI